jgi:hypothetical protein
VALIDDDSIVGLPSQNSPEQNPSEFVCPWKDFFRLDPVRPPPSISHYNRRQAWRGLVRRAGKNEGNVAYNVSFEIPPRRLGTADVEFRVKRGGRTLGKLAVSKGSLVWFPKGKSYGYKLRWNEFGLLIAEHGRRRAERR